MKHSRKRRVVVGLSGGVDSAVAALRLVESGFDVHALFMKNWEDDDSDTHCTAEADLADARQVADELAIPLHQVNFAAQYRREVFDHCLREFAAGRTPNPDVLCNREIKFKAFVQQARRLGADLVATGHYARLEDGPDGTRLLRAKDLNKDQSYFLHMVGKEAFSKTLFPLGMLDKPTVRRLAEDAGFDNFEKKDSTGICFIGEREFRTFLARYLKREPGPIVTLDGQVIGEHMGLSFYTLGQRQGLGIGGIPGHTGPWFVADKDLQGNRLVVVEGSDHPALLSAGLIADDLHWVAGKPPAAVFRAGAKTRYRQADQACSVRIAADGHCEVRFDHPQRAVTPGQSVVIYQEDVCLGGGVIRTPLAVTTERHAS